MEHRQPQLWSSVLDSSSVDDVRSGGSQEILTYTEYLGSGAADVVDFAAVHAAVVSSPVAMSSARLSLATALVVALVGTPRGVCFVGVGSAARTSREASAPRHGAVTRAIPAERPTPTRRGAMQTDAEEEIRAASLANVRNKCCDART